MHEGKFVWKLASLYPGKPFPGLRNWPELKLASYPGKSFYGLKNWPMYYTNWARGEPNNVNNKEGCLLMWEKHGYEWNDAPCYLEYCFVCENRFHIMPR